MAYAAGTQVSIPQYAQLQRELSKITSDKRLIAQKMAVAMRFAIKPTTKALEGIVSAIPRKTGNLRAAVASKVKSYKNSGNAVALVGYVKERRGQKTPDKKGRDRAYHQHLIEYGTKKRKTRKGANRGISPVGATPGVQPIATAYRNTIGNVNNRIKQKTPSVLKSVYKKLEQIRAQ